MDLGDKHLSLNKCSELRFSF